MEESAETKPDRRSTQLNLLKHALLHFGIVLGLLCLFAAADSWSALTGWKLATLLSVIMGFASGLAMTTVLHEWFHLLGARLSGGVYKIPPSPSFFIYDWKFEQNSTGQFFTMSVAGTIGGLLSVWLLAVSVVPDNPGRMAVVAGAVMSFALGSIIEWPVLRRTRSSGQPLEELAKVDQGVLTRALLWSAVAAALTFWWLG